MSTWHFEPWAHADIREISKDLTHQLPNPSSSHILKASIFPLQETYVNTLPCHCWAAYNLLLPVVPVGLPKLIFSCVQQGLIQQQDRWWCYSMVTTPGATTTTPPHQTWASFSLRVACTNTLARGPSQPILLKLFPFKKGNADWWSGHPESLNTCFNRQLKALNFRR